MTNFIKKHPAAFIVMMGAAFLLIGAYQYAELSGLFTIGTRPTIHFLFYPAYQMAGPLGVMLQWFVLGAVLVVGCARPLKRKQARERQSANPEAATAVRLPTPSVIERPPASFGRRGRA